MTPNDARARVLDLLTGIIPGDDLEREHRDRARAWAASGADLYRGDAADIPPAHLVVYFTPLTPDRQQILLVAHRKAGLWLPPGGHVEPGKAPWATVTREAGEFTDLRWWPLTDLRRHLDTPAAGDFEPHLARFLDKITASSS